MGTATLTKQDRETLGKSVLCGAMNDADMSNILTGSTIKNLKRSEYLFEKGDSAKTLYLILEGWVQITREEGDGSSALIATFERGQSFAEAAALLGREYPVTAQAMTDLRVLSINGAIFMDVLQSNREVLARSFASMFQKLHSLVDDVEWLKSRTIRERLVKFLLEHSKNDNAPCEVQLPYSKSIIAAKIGTSPEQLSRTFTALQKHGVVITGQTARIKDPNALRAVIERS